MRVILDSGAYSAWSKKKSINIDDYIAFCLQHIKTIDMIVNLDVIPGEFGRPPTYEESEASAQQGWDNYLKMIKAGIPAEKIIHVFHQGESWFWLEKFVSDGLQYIGISPANDKSTAEKISWLDKCMDYVTDSKGMPLLKFHGFGVTSSPIMFRYPWMSVDSTSWMAFGKYGIILVPKVKQGKYRYDISPLTVKISVRSPDTDHVDKHFDTMSPTAQDKILNLVESKGFSMGFSVYEDGKETIHEEGLCNNGYLRDKWNLQHFLEIQKSMTPWPWAFKRKLTLF